MDELKQELALRFFETAPDWLTRRQLDAVVTVFTLFGEGEASFRVGWGINKGQYRIDPRLIANLFAACPEHLRPVLVGMTPLVHLDPATFKRLFRETWQSGSMSPEQRKQLVYTLTGFIVRHPEHAEEYRDIILEAFRSRFRDHSLAAQGPLRYLNDVEPKELGLLHRRLDGAVLEYRMSVLNIFCEWLKRPRDVSPRVLAFCTSPEIRERAREIFRSDPDKNARTCAYFFLRALGAYHRAQPAGSTGRRRKRSARQATPR